jgi:hypothetical protein
MKLFKRNNNQSENTGAGLGRHRRPADTTIATPAGRTRDSQRMAQMGQNRTFSYHAARSQSEVTIGREAVQNKPPLRRLPTRFQRLRKHTGWLIGFVVLLGLVVYEMQLSTTPKVVSLSKTSDIPFLQESTVYQQAARKLFGASAANRNKLTVDTAQIATVLQVQFPELDKASIALPLIGSVPTVYIRAADPALVLAASNGSFVVDRNGRALAEANHANSVKLAELSVPTVTDQSNLEVKLGQQVLPKDAAVFIGTVVSQLHAKGVEVQSMTLPMAAGELDVYVTGKSYFVKFNLQQNGQQGGEDEANVQAGTFLAVKHDLERQGKQPSQYVDVRLEGRAYYR